MRTLQPLLSASAILSVVAIGSAQESTKYQLTEKATFERGCFPPCLCPMYVQQPISGSFVLSQVPGPLSFDLYNVTDVDWTTRMGDAILRFTGSGTYLRRTQGARTHRLQLDLQENGGEVVHYDSGDVPDPATFPVIDITISIHGMYCFDTAIRVTAEPAKPPPPPVTWYRLAKDSTWQRGCFPPCRCALGEELPLGGTFTLAFKSADMWYRTYAVDHIRWTVQSGNEFHYITGSGAYTIGGDFALTHRLVLDLQTDGGPPEHFDSGEILGAEGFPAINIAVSIHGAYCFDTVIQLRAKPVGDFNLDSSVDRLDLDEFLSCITGPAQPMERASCRVADLDDDDDVDQADFGLLQRCLTEPGQAVDPTCAD